MQFNLRREEIMGPGHLACQGCGGSLSMRLALKVLGPKTYVVMPACCWSVIAGPFPYSNLNVPLLHTAFETAASAASGVRAALDIRGETDATVLAWAGDGGTFDIGFQALSGAAERNENIIFTVYDNEAYMNTGIQRSSATPYGAWTTTTPVDNPKREPKKDIIRIMAAHGIPYVATANVAFPGDLMRKFEKAKKIKGTRFIHILSPCPPGWKIASEHSIEIARLATLANVFPLVEVEDGEKWTLNYKPESPVPVRQYMSRQGRFRHLKDADYQRIQVMVDRYWEKTLKSCGVNPDEPFENPQWFNSPFDRGRPVD